MKMLSVSKRDYNLKCHLKIYTNKENAINRGTGRKLIV